MMNEIYVSTDVEADGPIPGPHSMLSFASAALTAEGKLISTFTRNLELLDGAAADPETEAWWQKNIAAWEQTRIQITPPAEAMSDYLTWLKSLPGKPIFVGYPAAYDFLFVYWYLIRFARESPFSYSALDIRTFAMAVLGTSYTDAKKSKLPTDWLPRARHTHIALDDAIEQGELFCNMLVSSRSNRGRS